ncbi:MAG TPA: ATP-binding cassette domain-containing protein, partial [Candidatus Sulfotelmatobacter sp.]|nr:ATP-binding cassette domain-containing protein [Candidatus Sulfotelmatobacter sp.]
MCPRLTQPLWTMHPVPFPDSRRAEAMITARELTKSFGAVWALTGVSFEVSRGEIFGFVGPNGAGKTTSMRILAGLMAPSSG